MSYSPLAVVQVHFCGLTPFEKTHPSEVCSFPHVLCGLAMLVTPSFCVTVDLMSTLTLLCSPQTFSIMADDDNIRPYVRPYKELPDPAAVYGFPTSQHSNRVCTRGERTAPQTLLLLQQLHAVLTPEEGAISGGKWPASAKDYAVEFWSKHMSAFATSVAGFIYGLTLEKPKQAEVAEALADIGALPISVEVLRSWYGRYRLIQLGGTDPGMEFVPPQGEVRSEEVRLSALSNVVEGTEDLAERGDRRRLPSPSRSPPRSPHRPDDHARRPRSQSVSPDRHRGGRRSGSRSPPRGRRRCSSCSPGRSRSPDTGRRGSQHRAILSDLVEVMSSVIQSRGGSPQQASTAKSRADKHHSECQRIIDSDRYPDPVLVSGDYFRWLKGQGRDEDRLALGNGLYLEGQGRASASKKPTPHDPEAIRQGWDTILTMMAQSSSIVVKGKLADRISWGRDLFAQPLGSFAQKARFMQAYLDDYEGEESFKAYKSNCLLISTYLTGKSAGVAASSSSSGGGGGGGGAGGGGGGSGGGANSSNRSNPRDSGRGDRRDDRRGSGDRRGSNTAPGSSGKMCSSRVDPKVGRCKRGRGCPDMHDCVKPNCKDHCNAKDSKHFDIKDAESAIKRRGVGKG